MNRKRKAKAIVVNRTFDVSELPLRFAGMELYWFAAPNIIFIEGKLNDNPAVITRRKGGQFVCDCDQERINEVCKHVRAFGKGLWSRLVELSNRQALLTFTNDWCAEAVKLPRAYSPAIFSETAPLESVVR